MLAWCGVLLAWCALRAFRLQQIFVQQEKYQDFFRNYERRVPFHNSPYAQTSSVTMSQTPLANLPDEWVMLLECHEGPTKTKRLRRTWEWTCAINEPALSFSTSNTIRSRSGSGALEEAKGICRSAAHGRFPNMRLEFEDSEDSRRRNETWNRVRNFVTGQH